MPSKQTKAEEKGLPTNVDAERFVLGSILLDGRLYSHAAGALEADDFSLQKHRTIFSRMGVLSEEGEAINRVTVANCLMRFAELEACDGLSYIVSLDDGLPQNIDIDSYIRVVKDKATLRRIIFASQHTMNAALMAEEPPGEILRIASQRLAMLEAHTAQSSSIMSPADIVNQYGGIVPFMQEGVDPGISFGFPQMDELLLGLQAGCQYIIGGRTSMGKTAFGCNIAHSLARRKKPEPVGILSLEMSKEILLARMICSEAKIPLKFYLKHELNREQRMAALEAAPRILDLPIYIDDSPGLTITDMVQRVNEMVERFKIRVFMLDHIHRVNWAGDRALKIRDEYQGITIASWTACLLARKHTKAGNPLSSIILCQLSRPSDKKNAAAKAPDLEDLRATGALEQDATGVAMIHRPEVFLPGRPELRNVAEVYIRKARNGQRGKCVLKFVGSHVTFYDEGAPDQPQESEDAA